MFSSDYKNEMRKFLNHILKGSMMYLKYYWMNTDDDKSASEMREEIYHEVLDNNTSLPFKIKCGASKLAIMFEEFEDVVFKIPFIGSAALDEMEGQYMPYGIDAFRYATHDGSWNYCAADKDVYQRMLDCSPELEDFFCEIEFLTFIDNHPVYIQERADKTIEDINFDNYKREYPVSHNSLDFCEEDSVKDSLRDLAWGNTNLNVLFAKIYDDYGEDIAEELLRYMTEEIYDLHELNYGINKDGYIRIFDYSGFDS